LLSVTAILSSVKLSILSFQPDNPLWRYTNIIIRPIIITLDDSTARVFGCWHDTVVCLSVTLCTVAKWYILQQNCLKKWIGTGFYNFKPPYTSACGYSRQRRTIGSFFATAAGLLVFITIDHQRTDLNDNTLTLSRPRCSF